MPCSAVLNLVSIMPVEQARDEREQHLYMSASIPHSPLCPVRSDEVRACDLAGGKQGRCVNQPQPGRHSKQFAHIHRHHLLALTFFLICPEWSLVAGRGGVGGITRGTWSVLLHSGKKRKLLVMLQNYDVKLAKNFRPCKCFLVMFVWMLNQLLQLVLFFNFLRIYS